VLVLVEAPTYNPGEQCGHSEKNRKSPLEQFHQQQRVICILACDDGHQGTLKMLRKQHAFCFSQLTYF